MDLGEAIFASITALYTADTASGGLNEANGAARIERLVQKADANFDTDRADFEPLLAVDVFEKSDQNWGGDEATDTDQIMVRLTLTTFRDAGRTKQNAVSARMRMVFNGTVLAAQSGWVLGLLSLLRVYQGQTGSAKITLIQEYTIRAGVVGVDLVGAQSSVTFSVEEGSAISAGTLVGRSIDEDIELLVANVESFNDQSERITRQGLRSTITAAFTNQTHAAVIPVGTRGTLVVYSDTAGGHANTYANAMVTRRRWSSSTFGDGPPQFVYLTFRMTGDEARIKDGEIGVVAS